VNILATRDCADADALDFELDHIPDQKAQVFEAASVSDRAGPEEFPKPASERDACAMQSSNVQPMSLELPRPHSSPFTRAIIVRR
jgi:hypothetical protein